MLNSPVVGNLVQVILDLLVHRRLLVRQPLQLAPHDAGVILQQPLPRLDVLRAEVEDLLVQHVLLLGVLHLGVAVAVGLPLLVIVVVAAVEVVELLEGGHLCAARKKRTAGVSRSLKEDERGRRRGNYVFVVGGSEVCVLVEVWRGKAIVASWWRLTSEAIKPSSLAGPVPPCSSRQLGQPCKSSDKAFPLGARWTAGERHGIPDTAMLT